MHPGFGARMAHASGPEALNVAAALALAVVLSFPTVALAASQGRERDRDRGAIARVIKKIQKIFGVTPTDLPMPPLPGDPPKP